MNCQSKSLIVGAGIIAAALLMGAALQTKESGKPKNAGMQGDDMHGNWEMPKPGPEHAMLKKWEGTWDATNEMMGKTTKAVSTSKMVCGGLWLQTEYKDEAGFTGFGQDGYDTMKKMYVSTWIDSMSTHMMTMEGSFDAKTKTCTMTGEMPDMTGKMGKAKSTTTWVDDNTAVFVMEMPGMGEMKITYKRRK